MDMGNSCGGSTAEPEATQVPKRQEEREEKPDCHIDTDTPSLGTPYSAMNKAGLVRNSWLGLLLEFFTQLCLRSVDIFKRITTVHKHDAETRGPEMLMQRSLSFGHDEELRLSRFKVKPIDSGGSTSGKGASGGGKTKSGGSK